jgi:formamidase
LDGAVDETSSDGAPVIHELRVDRSIPVRERPDRCHTRWHPDIPPVLTCQPSDEVLIETRDAVDGQFTLDSTNDDVLRADRSIVHPLTGPIRVDGAEPGDVLAVEVLEVVPSSFGYTAQIPGFGFLADEFPEPFLVRWEVDGRWAASPDMPDVRVPAAPFMGTMGVAPSRSLLGSIAARERALKAAGADVAMPDPNGAVPATEPIASQGLRTKPPRENGGNLDVRAMGVGTTILFPVWVEGANLSVGDGHVAQGDGEVCGTAIETAATVRVRLDLRPGAARQGDLRDVAFETPAQVVPRGGPAFSTTGLSVYTADGGMPGDLTQAARAALRNMIAHLVVERGLSRRQAYALCSVVVDLTVAEVVDLPNAVVTATLPLDVFT